MNMDIMDSITELQTTQKEAKAIMEGFMQQFTTYADKKLTLLTIDSHFEQFQLTAQVICELLGKATEQAATLEALADAEQKKAV